MDINYNLVSLIDFLAVVQGVLLGFILVFGNRKNRPSLLLGLFLITYSIELLPSILNDTLLIQYNSYLLFLPIKFLFLSPVFLYLYARSITQTISIRNQWILFVPAIIEFIVSTWLYLLNPITKSSLLERATFSIYYKAYFYIAILYTICFALLTIRIINVHQEKVLEYYSNTENRQLKWVKAIAIFLIVYGLLWFLPTFLPFVEIKEYTYAFLSVFNVVFIFWAGLSGLQQSLVNMADENHINETTSPTQNLPNRQITSDRNEEIFKQLIHLLEKQKLFKQPDLTLPVLASKLNITRRNLSQIINQKTESNFNYFINQYRITEAKKKLKDSDFEHLNMLGIAYEVGFNSKATFFAVFKKIAGISPGMYKKQHLEQK